MVEKTHSIQFANQELAAFRKDGAGAAEEFEAMLVAQLLRAARESEASDASGAPLLEMAEDKLARVIAAQGGLGLGRMIAGHLSEQEAGAEDSHNPALDR